MRTQNTRIILQAIPQIGRMSAKVQEILDALANADDSEMYVINDMLEDMVAEVTIPQSSRRVA